MKKLLILLFICLCTACSSHIVENNNTLIVVSCNNTNIKDGVTTYKICVYDSDGAFCDYILYRAKFGTFEVGDTIKLIKYVE